MQILLRLILRLTMTLTKIIMPIMIILSKAAYMTVGVLTTKEDLFKVFSLWFKRFPTIYERLSQLIGKCLTETMIYEWRIRETQNNQRHVKKGRISSKYVPKTCIQMWKIIIIINISHVTGYSCWALDTLPPYVSVACQKLWMNFQFIECHCSFFLCLALLLLLRVGFVGWW